MAVKILNLSIPTPGDLYSVVINKIISATEALRDCVYPIGGVFITIDQRNPGEYLGGTWEAITDRYLVGIGPSHPAGTTGGASVHRHEIPLGWDTANGLFGYTKDDDTTPKFGSRTINRGNSLLWKQTGEGKQDWLRVAYTDEVNIEPPFFPVYMWYRTA